MTIKAEEIVFGAGKPAQMTNKLQTICELFYYQPDNIEQAPLGNLYIVGQLSLVKDCGHLNNLLAALIKREYYLYPAKGAFKSFQTALARANSHLGALAKEENSEWLGKLHFICAAISQSEIIFAQAGGSSAYLCRQNHLTNLTRKAVPEPAKPHPAKIFSSIVTGKIENNDRLLLATPLIEELFSPVGIKDILCRPTIQETTDQINRVLREEDKPVQLAALILEVKEDEPIQANFPKSDKPKNFITPPIDLNEIIK